MVIGKALASLPHLHTLALLHCNTGDLVCRELYRSKSLLRLRTRTFLLQAVHCGVTEEGAQQIAMIQQLEELVMGKPSDDSD